MSEFAQLLEAIGRRPDEIAIISYMAPGARMANIWTTVADAPEVVEELSGKANVWFSVQPVKRREAKGRARAENVAALVALYADLDFKEGGLPDVACVAVIRELSAILGADPVAVVRSGGGLQPYWRMAEPVDPGIGELLLAGWRQLVVYLAAKHGGKADSGVYDLPRILRVPGPRNLKTEYGPDGAPTGCSFPGGAGWVDHLGALEAITAAIPVIEAQLPEEMRPKLSAPGPDGEVNPRENVERGTGTPWDDFNTHAEWDEILEPMGWTLHSRDSSGTLNWSRPGKNPRDGFSATTGYKGFQGVEDRLWVFTDNAPPFEQGKLYSKAEAVCLIRYRGDRAATTRALSGAGYGEKRMDWADRANDPAVQAAMAERAEAAREIIANPFASPEVIQEAERILREAIRSIYVDMQAEMDGTDKPAPTVLRRRDGQYLFYKGAVNAVYGDPGDGKTWVILAAMAEVLREGGKAVFIDMDHNGARSIGDRLMLLGVGRDLLYDQTRFRMAIPEDEQHIDELVEHLQLDRWCDASTVVGIDSIGELLPMLSSDSNSADDYSRANRRVMTKLANTGACVIAADHMSKAADSRAYGATGTVAKKRAMDGSYIKVVKGVQFVPGKGGTAKLYLAKDRHGMLAVGCEQTREPWVGTFSMQAPDPVLGQTDWWISDPQGGDISKIDDARQGDPTVAARMRRDVLAYLMSNGTASATDLRNSAKIPGDTKKIKPTLEWLVEHRLVEEQPAPRGGHHYTAVAVADLPLEAEKLRDELVNLKVDEED